MPTKRSFLSPSDFAFLWEECRTCFYHKVKSGFLRPRPIMPKIFTVIDGQMKTFFSGKRTEEIAPGLPKGTVAFSEGWVESVPIGLPGRSPTTSLRGKFDTGLKFDDGTFGIVDFKTSAVKTEHAELYGRQLHAYAYALENPVDGGFALRPISRLGLLVYEPQTLSRQGDAGLALAGPMRWIEIPRDDHAFMEFLSEVVAVVERPSPPAGSPSCQWCAYRDVTRRTAL